MDEIKIAAAYIRVSTEDQVEYSPASQLEKIKEYAKRNGYILPEEYIFRDEGISGRNTKKRVEFNRMIGIAKQKPKPFDTILLWKFSRFAYLFRRIPEMIKCRFLLKLLLKLWTSITALT